MRCGICGHGIYDPFQVRHSSRWTIRWGDERGRQLRAVMHRPSARPDRELSARSSAACSAGRFAAPAQQAQASSQTSIRSAACRQQLLEFGPEFARCQVQRARQPDQRGCLGIPLAPFQKANIVAMQPSAGGKFLLAVAPEVSTPPKAASQSSKRCVDFHQPLVAGNTLSVCTHVYGRRWRFVEGRLQEPRRRHIESLGQAAQSPDGWIADAPFDVTHIAALHAGFERECFLRQPLLSAQVAHVSPKESHQIHPRSWRDQSALFCPPIVSFSGAPHTEFQMLTLTPFSRSTRRPCARGRRDPELVALRAERVRRMWFARGAGCREDSHRHEGGEGVGR